MSIRHTPQASPAPSTMQRHQNRFTPRLFVSMFAVLLVLLLAIQLVPYGRAHTNPAVQAEPAWNSTETRALFFYSTQAGNHDGAHLGRPG